MQDGQIGDPETRHVRFDDRQIAYKARAGAGPTIMFLPGYGSDMGGSKAVALDAFASRRGLAALRFDYSGTGSSDGQFTDGTLDRWLDEALAALDQLTRGPVILVGSSMGGWIALHLACLRPERISALVGIASAPDFTQWGFSSEQLARLDEHGSPTRQFWQSGKALLVLEKQIPIDCPVRLIHGELDEDVPLEIAMRTLRLLRSADVQLIIVKGGGHRLSQPREIDIILRTIANLLEPAT